MRLGPKLSDAVQQWLTVVQMVRNERPDSRFFTVAVVNDVRRSVQVQVLLSSHPVSHPLQSISQSVESFKVIQVTSITSGSTEGEEWIRNCPGWRQEIRSRRERFSDADEKSTATELKSHSPGDWSK